MTEALYPPSPVLADTSFLEPSSAFRTRTYRMIGGIVLFVLLYLLLIAFGFGVLIAAVALAVAAVSAFPHWFTIVIAFGLFGLGAMFFFFTIKFIFARTKAVDPMGIEITDKDQPVLFEFISKLSMEVGTDFPRKIFLAPDVNASVSYDSSFWSMFFPVRKNLHIGLGLVNCLNVSEFKATLAHEFGHFSQRSMKAGSYVYTANKIIFDLAYQRDRFDALLDNWRSAGGIFGAFAVMTSFFVESVRKILHVSYQALNVTYMALSREMEYHADLVACSAAGNEAMVNTLRKIEFADFCYSATISALNELVVKNKKKTFDIYAFNTKMLEVNAALYKMHSMNGLVTVTSHDIKQATTASRLVIKNQWASHPSLEEREASIGRFSIQSPIVESSAWVLFTNPAMIKKEMTKKLYASVETKDLADATDEEMNDCITRTRKRTMLPPTFRNVYDHRWLSAFDAREISKTSTTMAFDSLFNSTTATLVSNLMRDSADLEQLKHIEQKNIKIDFFEYDNVRYKAKEAGKILDEVEAAVARSRNEIQELDENIFRFFYAQAKEAGQEGEYIQLYKDLAASFVDFEIGAGFATRLGNMTNEISTRSNWSVMDLGDLSRKMIDLEKHIKNFIQGLPEAVIRAHFIEPENIFKYLKTAQMWNYSIMEPSEQGMNQLHEYVACISKAVEERTWDATLAIYYKQLSLTPSQYLVNS